MGNLTVKRGDIQIDYGSFKINNGTTTWIASNRSDNSLTFATSATPTAAVGFKDSNFYTYNGAYNWTVGTDSTGNLTFTGSAGSIFKLNNTSSSKISVTPVGTASSAIELGVNRTESGYAYIDLTGDTTYTDYGLRVIRGNTGADTWSEITHRGIGDFNIAATEAAKINFKTTNITRGLWTAGGNLVIGNYTTDIQSAYKLQLDTSSRVLIGGGLTVGANQANTDAAIHVAGVGNTTNNRMIQLGGNGTYSLSIAQGATGNWMSWGVDSSNRWCINSGTTFTTTGFMMNASHEFGFGGIPVAGTKGYFYGNIYAKLEQNSSTSLVVENLTNGTGAQSVINARALGGYTNFGCVGTGWAVSAGASFEVLNGGGGYMNTTTGKLNLISNHASGVINILSGGASNSNIRLRISSTGTFAFGYGDLTTATEKIQIKNGSIKLDGVSGAHGIIFPDSTFQTTAATPYSLPMASTTVLGGVKVDGSSITINESGVVSAAGKHVVQDKGSAVTTRTNINFVGSLVSVTDDSANDATVVTINPSGVILSSERGSANGVASLDADGIVPVTQLRYFPRRIQTLTNVSGNVTLDWSTYDEIRLTLSGNTTLTFTGALEGQGCVLKIRQDVTGGRTVILPMSVRYNTDINTYVQTTTAGAIDRLGFIYDGEDNKYDFVSMTRNLV